MADEVASTPQGNDAAPSLEESFNAALSEHGITDDAAPKEEQPTQSDSTSKAGEQASGEEPEHVKWFKNFRGPDGKPFSDPDAALKHAYEVNKWATQKSQEAAALRRELQQRKEQEAAPKKSEATEEREKTDLEILEDVINNKVKTIVDPIVQQVEKQKRDFVGRQVVNTVQNLREHFGETGEKDAQGNPIYVYDTIIPEVTQVVGKIFEQTGRPLTQEGLDAFVTELVDAGQLFNVYRTIGTNILFPKYREQQAKAKDIVKQQEVAREKATQLPARGTSARLVKQETSVDSIQDAARLAEQETGYKFA